MSSQMFPCLANGYGLAGISIDEAQVSGVGGAVYPRLIVPVKIEYYPLREPLVDYVINGLDAQLMNDRVGKLADAISIRLQRVQRAHLHYVGPDNLSLEFPLDVQRITEMERQRDGKDLNLRVDVHLTAEEHSPIEGDEQSRRPTIWGIRCALHLTAQLAITIPRDVWISRVLPNVGYGVIHLLEFPAIALEACVPLSHAFKALKQAQELHKIGHYDDAVGKCRVALDQFFQYVDKPETDQETGKTVVRRIPVLKKSWENQLGAATYAWLDQTLGAIKDASNRPHHSPNVHYSQLDSQMILAITTAVVAYIARTVKPEDLKS